MQSERWLGHQQPSALGERQHVSAMGQPTGVHGQHAGLGPLAGGLDIQHHQQQHLWPSNDNNPFIQQQAGLQAGGQQQQQAQAGPGQGESARRQAAGGSGTLPPRTMQDLMLEMGVDPAFQRTLQSMEQPLVRTQPVLPFPCSQRWQGPQKGQLGLPGWDGCAEPHIVPAMGPVSGQRLLLTA